jgi:PAS domain S-box-containing protein
MNGSQLPSSVPPTSDRERIWNVSHDLLIVADANGNLRSINPAWTTTLGWSEGDLLGRTFDWLCHPDDRARTPMELAGWRRAAKRCLSRTASVTRMAHTAGCPGEP